MIRVIIADDHAVVRDGLRALLETHPEISVVADAPTGQQAVDQVQALQPDIVIMDISMPEMNGIDATRQIMEISPRVRVVILSMLGSAEHIFQSLGAGARGYLLKESAGREVVQAVEMVYAGGYYFSQPVTQTLVDDYLHPRPKGQTDRLNSLSEREKEIFYLVVKGLSSADIGKNLNLSPKTVESYRSRMMQKLGVSDMTGLIKFAIQQGLIPLE